MKSGICPKCGKSEVRGDLSTSHGISVDRMAFPRINTILLVCTNCGFLEFYVEDENDLARIKTKFQKVEN